MSFSPNNVLLAVGGQERVLRTFDLRTGREVGLYRGHDDAVGSICFLPSNEGLCSAGYDDTVRVWDYLPPGILHHSAATGRVNSVTACGDSRVTAATSPKAGVIQIVDPLNPAKTRRIESVSAAVALSPDGATLAAASFYNSEKPGDSGTRLWSASTGKEGSYIPGMVGPLAWAGRSLLGVRATASETVRGEVVIWDYEFDREVGSLAGHAKPIRFLPLTSDGSSAASADTDEVRLWNLGERSLRSRFAVQNLGALALRPDGGQIATAAVVNKAISLREPGTGRETMALKLSASVKVLAYSPDNRRLAAGCDDGTVRIWDVATGQLLLTLADLQQPVCSLAFDQAGRWLIAGTDGKPNGDLIVWGGRD